MASESQPGPERRAGEDGRGSGAAGGDGASNPGEHPLPPGPDGYPLVGNTLALVRDPFGFLDSLREHGDVVRYRALGERFAALFHPEYVERVLVAEPDRFERWDFSEVGIDFATEGLLLSEGRQWRTQRRLLQPAFTMERIRSYADTMVECAEETAAEWDDGQAVVLNEAFADLTLRIFGSAMFDVDIDPGGEDAAIPRVARAVNERANVQGVSTLLPEWVPTPADRRFRRAMDRYRERMDDLLARRRDGEDGEDLLSILLHAEGDGGDTLSEAEVRDNMLTFLFAGHETTSLALTYAAMLLAEHDGAAARLREELDEVVGGDRPGVEHVPRLEYTEAVAREAMRLYPPVYAVWREVSEDAVIGGYRIPEGTLLTLSQYTLHRDGRFHDDPEAFRPDRWTGDGPDHPEYAYFPFGGGPRHCIGMRFAMLELQLVLAVVARRFDLSPASDPDPDLSPGATLRPADDVRVRVRRR